MLISEKAFTSVVVISSGIAATPIARWKVGGDLNDMLLATLRSVKKKYKVTHIIWHQGESDFPNTTSQSYVESFQSLRHSLHNLNINSPIYSAIATKCGPNEHWSEDNPTALGQMELIDNKNIFLGANTDKLLLEQDRKSDQCHLSESGQIKTAKSYATAIINSF